MPSIKFRQGLRAGAITLGTAVNREIYIDPFWLLTAACPVTGLTGCLAITQGVCVTALKYTSVSSACIIGATMPVPQDIALVNAIGGGSGVAYLDWADAAAACTATIGASLYMLPTGCLGSGGSQLMACSYAAMAACAVDVINTASFAQFQAPATRDGIMVWKFRYMSACPLNTTGANFMFYGLHFRYKADRIGSS